MGLRNRLTTWALARPHVLLVDAPDARRLRFDVEAELDRRRWSMASSPADADVVLVLGTPGRGLSEAVDVLWSQVPQPRHRTSLGSEGVGVAGALDDARDELVLAARAPEPRLDHGEQEMGHGEMGHGEVDHGGGGHGEVDHGGGGHHMHHGGEVAGLAMAATAPDRDGLQLDALRIRLGPVLAGWPTALVLDAAMQGDVLTEVELSWLGAPPADSALPPTATSMDRLASFLLVAGWDIQARRAREARTLLLSPLTHDAGRNAARRVAQRVRASRTLAWSVAGIGGPPGGDVWRRVQQWCDAAEGGDLPTPVPPDDVAASLQGSELAAVRLSVASLDVAAPRSVVAEEHLHG